MTVQQNAMSAAQDGTGDAPIKKSENQIMKIICAFDSFKGCMTAKDACHAAASGLQTCYPNADIQCLPMSDGGEGMVDCIAEAVDAKMVNVKVHDPLMIP